MPQKYKVNVAVIEDNSDLCDMIVEDILAAGYDATGFASVEEFQLVSMSFDIFILDLNLPGISGLQFIDDLRANDKNVGLIVLSCRTGSENRTIGYQLGVDIYLQKPCGSQELLAALGRVSNRILFISEPMRDNIQKYRLVVDELTLLGPCDSVVLTPRELGLLLAFLNAPQQQLGYHECKFVFSGGNEMKNAAFEVGLGRFRKKMNILTGLNKSIVAIRGEGYRLIIKIQIE